MNKISSTDIINAIEFSNSDPRIAAAIKMRDDDNRLDCAYIRGRVLSKINSDIKVFEIIFNYAYVNGQDRSGEDLAIQVENDRGKYRVLKWGNQ